MASNSSSSSLFSISTSTDVSEHRLKRIFDNVIALTADKASSVKREKFKKTFPEIHQHDVKSLCKFREQLFLQLKTYFLEEVEEIANQYNLFKALTELEEEIKLNEDNIGMKLWRPSGNAQEDIRDHLHRLKLKHKKCLEFVLQTYNAENASLSQIRDSNHEKILEIQSQMETKRQELKNHFTVLKDTRFQQLQEKRHTLSATKPQQREQSI